MLILQEYYKFSWALFVKSGSVKSPIQKRIEVSLATLPNSHLLDQFSVQVIFKSFKGLDKNYCNVRHVVPYGKVTALISASVPAVHVVKTGELGHTCIKLP